MASFFQPTAHTSLVAAAATSLKMYPKGSLRDMAVTLSYQGQYDEAVPMLEESLALAQCANIKVGASWLTSALGFAVMGQGDHDRAEELFQESLRVASKADKHRIPDSLEGVAEIELARAKGRTKGKEEQEKLRRAATLLGAAEGARRILSTKIIPVREPVRDLMVSMARSQLGAQEYERGYALGRAMSLEEASSYA